GGALVRLVHDGLTEEQATSHAEGWEHFLERLQRAAVTGDAGPDEWDAVPAELNQLTSADATLAVCQHVLRGVTEADRDRRTPCTEFTVAQLLDHLEDSLVSLGAMAGGEVDRASSGDAESRMAFVAQQTLEAWQRRGLDGTVKAGDSEMQAAFAAGILSIELLIHAWDLAAATGQKVPVSEPLAGYVLTLAEQTISPQLRAGGSFAEAVEVGADAPMMDRLVAFSGRTLA
ncbi:MAG: TIGR03086 family metal-binding protein, partial [Actinomycetota bacterium]|nr:TIGR03086 family metal-binding protein [Actinomycetota bacterium]